MICLTSIFLFFEIFLLITAEREIYFKEDFNDASSLDRWVKSTLKADELGQFALAKPKEVNDIIEDQGLKTTEDSRFYGISTKFTKAFSNKGQNLCLQFTVKHEQNIDCGGGYVKLLGSDIDGSTFHGDSPYLIMFGPDMCGFSVKTVHVILNYEGKNHMIKKEISCKSDTLTHLYTLILRPDNTYDVLIDNQNELSGSIEEDWEIDAKMIDDPTQTKPEDWDSLKEIPDPSAQKPDDWDDKVDGEWTAPLITNPEHKEWVPTKIQNPDYKGHPDIYAFDNIGGIGFDLWQVKSGTIFDNLLLTDDPDYCISEGERVWRKRFEFEEKIKKEEEARLKEMESEQDNKKDGKDEFGSDLGKEDSKIDLNAENIDNGKENVDQDGLDSTEEAEEHIREEL